MQKCEPPFRTTEGCRFTLIGLGAKRDSSNSARWRTVTPGSLATILSAGFEIQYSLILVTLAIRLLLQKIIEPRSSRSKSKNASTTDSEKRFDSPGLNQESAPQENRPSESHFSYSQIFLYSQAFYVYKTYKNSIIEFQILEKGI